MIIGIDPGVKGAYAVYMNQAVDCHDLPTLTIKVNKSEKVQLDLHRLYQMLKCYEVFSPHVVIEQVNAMPKQGITSAFNFGFTNGALHSMIVCLGYPLSTITPGVWKRAMGIASIEDKADRKDAARKRACQLFPQVAGLFSRVKDDGRAEAALLAYYAHHMKGVPL
jgi:crossover junction endodeoxyribonuclease RuvC